MFTELSVDGHEITARATDAQEIQFIANGKVIAKQAIGNNAVTVNLDDIEGAEDFEYVRVELKGEGGMCLSQALIIDDGSEPLEFSESKGLCAMLHNLFIKIKGTKAWTIIQEIVIAVKNKIK